MIYWKNILKLSSILIIKYMWFQFLRGLFNIKVILVEEQLWYYSTNSCRVKGVHAFPMGITPKMKVIVWLVFELTTILLFITLFTTPCTHSRLQI